jgi:D-arabinose 1-dehydrogenase-like Zn-dependent alcohol dehydrogenase
MPETMLAARFHAPNEPLRLEQVPMPSPGEGQVLIEVAACGLCGSDLHILKGETFTGFTPIIMGHEAAGRVAALGPGVSGWGIGDRVAVNCVQSCGVCLNCQRGRDNLCLNRKLTGIHLDGALAPYMTALSRSLVRLPEGISFEQGAVATDAAATPYHALKARGGLTSGDSLAIFGAGGLGSHAVMLGRMMGASPIFAVDVNQKALDRALELGADHAVRADQGDAPQAIKDLTGGRGVELALECVGSGKVLAQAAAATAPGGRTVVVGLSPDPLHLDEITPWVRSEVCLIPSSAFSTREIQELVDLAAAGRLDLGRSVTRTLPLSEVNQALDLLDSSPGDIMRLVVNSF